MTDLSDRDPHLNWTERDEPRSGRFGDVYFSAEDGLGETRAVFLAGCGLPDAWRGRSRFTVAELGFGTGLNIAALLDLWRRERPPGGHLSIFSVEGFPLSRDEAARALGRFGDLEAVTASLLDRWPAAAPGFHRIDLPELGATIDLAVMEAAEALQGWSGPADAWFLDGFSPASNPQMWRDEILDLVTARSAPGARVATFTVAGAVRRGLAERGFAVSKEPGFGRKRERLEARAPGTAAAPDTPSAIVIGAGIAGAALVRALGRFGVAPTVLAQSGSAQASGNAAALVTPRFDAGDRRIAGLHAQALRHAAAAYRRDAPDAVLAEGVVQLEAMARDAARFDKIAIQDVWAPGAVRRLSPDEASALLDEPVDRGGLFLADALTVAPAAIPWLDAAERLDRTVGAIERDPQGWRVLDAAGTLITRADLVFLANGAGLAALRPDLPITPVRGQASMVEGVPAPVAAAWGGYAVPTHEGLLFGATHDRGDTATDPRAEDDARNLETLRRALPRLAEAVAGRPIVGRAAVRATTPDRSPLCGELAPGLLVLGGLGSRGFALAPLLADHLAAIALGAPSPLPADLAELVRPDRFPS